MTKKLNVHVIFSVKTSGHEIIIIITSKVSLNNVSGLGYS